MAAIGEIPGLNDIPVSEIRMEEIGKISSEQEGCFKWNIKSFGEAWGKYPHWCSPKFNYSNRIFYLRIMKVHKPIIEVGICLCAGSYPNSYVEFQLQTECNIVSRLYGFKFCSKTLGTAVSVSFREFLSEGFLTPLHDRLTVLLRMRELKSGDVPPDEFWTLEKMLQDFNSLLVSGENCDVTLVVGGKKFPAHRIILCARSPVFKAMLCHDTTERESGTVNIDDCDPDSFLDFLTYVYTGSTRHINTENVISLYSTSDKYLMGELKEACVSFMKTNMSVEGFCGIAILALRHEEKDLIKLLTNFFCENVKQIIDTEDWVTFFKDNPIDAYKHFVEPSLSKR